MVPLRQEACAQDEEGIHPEVRGAPEDQRQGRHGIHADPDVKALGQDEGQEDDGEDISPRRVPATVESGLGRFGAGEGDRCRSTKDLRELSHRA